jgi:hypothetical protein
MNRRILNRLIAVVALAAATGYLFSLFPKANTPDLAYDWAAFLAVGVVLQIVEMVLLARQSEEDRRRNRKVWNDSDPGTYVVWTRSAIGLWLAAAGFFIAWRTGGAMDLHGTVSVLAFAEVVFAVALAVLFCGLLVPTTPRRATPGLFILGGLLIVAAGVAPLLRPLGASWSARGFHPTYLLAASGVIVLAAGVFARREARRLGAAGSRSEASEPRAAAEDS